MEQNPLKKAAKTAAPAKSANRSTPSGYYPPVKRTLPKSGTIIDKKTNFNKVIVAKKGGAIKTKSKK